MNLVVEDDGRFNFAGAARPGVYSGKALRTPFAQYDELLPSAAGKKIDIPHVMGQEKYSWILRPTYALPA